MKDLIKKAATELADNSVLAEAQRKADQELAKLASEGDLDAIKLLSERMQDREELKLRKELFGV